MTVDFYTMLKTPRRHLLNTAGAAVKIYFALTAEGETLSHSVQHSTNGLGCSPGLALNAGLIQIVRAQRWLFIAVLVASEEAVKEVTSC